MTTLKHKTEKIPIMHNGSLVNIVMKWEGETKDPPMLMLPAISTISSSNEWNNFKKVVSNKYQTITLDWPGFGDSEKKNIKYDGTILKKTLEEAINIIKTKNNQGLTIIAAGHSAAILLALEDKYFKRMKKVVLIAPTWRGPLPSMTGWSPKKLNIINNIIRVPVIGSIIYFINTTKMVLRFMSKRHVWLKANKLNTEKMNRLQNISRQKGARFASAAFVTGSLDIGKNNKWWIKSAQRIKERTIIVIPKDSPKNSLSEMVALSHNCKKILYIRGRLGCHEEFGEKIANKLFC